MRAVGWGIPKRMARAMEAVFAREGRAKHRDKLDLIHDLMADVERVPLADDKGHMTTDRDIAVAAEKAVRAVSEICYQLMTTDAILAAVAELCARRGIAPPKGDTDEERIRRAADEAWWRRHLRTEWKRRLEHTSIQLGLTYVRTDPYVSREVAAVQAAQNQSNADLLARQIATNEHGQAFTLAELAAKGTANKTLRRGELMTRIRGFEECADVLRHVGMFFTITCPSKFHSVGGTNAKYNGATPRDAQAYLVAVWARIRAALHRAGIRPYGFRIAEPHSDGCPHWHLLLFVAPEHVERMDAAVRAHALDEDGDEAGAQANRVKLVRIEAGKGTAAGYIAKYVSKNIDGAGVGDHKTFENGTTYIIAPDLFGSMELTPSARVTYWSQVWGIRQFQQIGGAPIGIWRELRRVKAETLLNAPEAVRAAHAAAQKIESDDPAVAKQASFADYLRAQGGPAVMRRALAVRIAARRVTINGRYATYEDRKPVGVYASAFPLEVFEGVHYRWTISDGRSSAALTGRPRTGVNNCTGAPAWTRPECGAPAPGAAPCGPVRHERTHNAGFNRPGDKGWSKAADRDTVERFKKHSPRHAGSHLKHLQRKYAHE